MLILLILGEGAILFVTSSDTVDTVLEDNWPKLDEKVQEDIAEQLECMNDDGTITASVCVDAARSEAQAAQRMIYYVCGGIITYQLIMMAFTVFYLRGLKEKFARIKDIRQDKDKHNEAISMASDGLEELNSRDYKNIKHI